MDSSVVSSHTSLRIERSVLSDLDGLQRDWCLVDNRFRSKSEVIRELVRCYKLGAGN